MTSKIAFFHPYSNRMGGSQRVALLLAAQLSGLGYEPVLICPEPGALVDEARGLGIEALIHRPEGVWAQTGQEHASLTKWMGIGSFLRLVSYWRSLARLLKSNDIALLHCHDRKAVVLAAVGAKLARVPALWHVHAALSGRRAGWLAFFLARLVDYRVPVSRSVLTGWALPRWMLGRHEVIPNGISAARRQGTSDDARKVHTIVTIGSLQPQKGQLNLIRALPKIVSRIGPVDCLLVGATGGDDSYRNLLIEESRRLGIESNVSLLGYRTDTDAILARASVVAIPSDSEAFGLVALEAMNQERPVVAASTGGLTEIVVDGETGLLVPPRDSEALADAIVRVLDCSTLARRLGAAGARRVSQEYSAEVMAERFSRLYERMLGYAPALPLRE